MTPFSYDSSNLWLIALKTMQLLLQILNTMIVGDLQNFQFSRQITWFHGKNRALSEFKEWIFHYLVSIIKFQDN